MYVKVFLDDEVPEQDKCIEESGEKKQNNH